MALFYAASASWRLRLAEAGWPPTARHAAGTARFPRVRPGRSPSPRNARVVFPAQHRRDRGDGEGDTGSGRVLTGSHGFLQAERQQGKPRLGVPEDRRADLSVAFRPRSPRPRLGPSGFLLGHLAGPLPELGDDVRPAPVPRAPAQPRQRRPGHVAGRRARSASSASMALMCARMGPRTGEPGNARLRLTIRWRRARSSSLSVIPLTVVDPVIRHRQSSCAVVITCGDAAHAGQHVPVTVVRLRRPLRPGPCLGNAGPGQFQPVEERRDVGG